MIDEKRIKEARNNIGGYIAEGLVKKERNREAEEVYLKNSDISLKTAEKLMKDDIKPYLWVIVCSYYSMFYIANAVLSKIRYKVGDKVAHKITSDLLVAVVLDKMKKELIDNYEDIKTDALEIASIKAESLIENYDIERRKRSDIQYKSLDEIKEQKARISLQRAREFVFEMRVFYENK